MIDNAPQHIRERLTADLCGLAGMPGLCFEEDVGRPTLAKPINYDLPDFDQLPIKLGDIRAVINKFRTIKKLPISKEMEPEFTPDIR